jgi:hypothetical protein
MANDTCGKTIVAGTIHRGSTVLISDRHGGKKRSISESM